jgi:hypothetical protein
MANEGTVIIHFTIQDIVALIHNLKVYSLVQLLFCRELLEMVRKMIQRG